MGRDDKSGNWPETARTSPPGSRGEAMKAAVTLVADAKPSNYGFLEETGDDVPVVAFPNPISSRTQPRRAS